jgi:hypothetical protein
VKRIALLLMLALAGTAHAQTSEREPPPPEQIEAAPEDEAPIEAEPAEASPEEPAPEPIAAEPPTVTEPPLTEPPPQPERRNPHEGYLDPCAQHLRSRPVGPLQIGELDGMLGVPYRACPRDEFAIGGGFLLRAHTADFYGHILADGNVRISGLLDRNVEGFLVWEAFRFERVLSSVNADYLGTGYLSWGVTARVFEQEGRVLAVTGRFVVPAMSGLHTSSYPIGLDLGVSAAWQVDPNLRLHMWATLLGSIGLSSSAPAQARAGIRVGGGLDWHPLEWLGLVLELQTGFAYLDALDIMAANVGFRLALGDAVGLELAIQVPFLGVRTFDDGAISLEAALNLSWRWR